MATDVTPEIALMTAEEFAERPSHEPPEELVRGRVVTLTQPRPRHGEICVNIVVILGSYVKARDLGHLVCNDSGVVTERNPDTVRGADVAYYSYERVPKGRLPKNRYLTEAPDLVFEVRSPSDRWPDILEKVAEYLQFGVRAVVLLEQEPDSARVFRPDGRDETLGPDDVLTLPEILGDFRTRVSAFFD